MSRWVLILLVAVGLMVASVSAADRVLRADITVDAGLADVWAAWTTETGIRTFFAPAARIDARVDGVYEVLFDPAAKAGLRGAEDQRILVFEPHTRLSFTWNAPATLPTVREQRTVVTIEFSAVDDGHTRLRFTHAGWGQGAEWDAAFAYFDRAWGGFVLPSLVHRFKEGPMDWQKMPALASLPSMRREVVER